MEVRVIVDGEEINIGPLMKNLLTREFGRKRKKKEKTKNADRSGTA